MNRYFTQDVAYCVGTSAYFQLAKESRAVRYVRTHLERATDCTVALKEGRRVEALEFFYTCARDLILLHDFAALVTEHNWRGFVWGVWLCMLVPDATREALLQQEREKWPENEWIVGHQELNALARECIALVERLPLQQVPIRLAPAKEEQARMRSEQERIRAIYRDQGAQAALAAAEGTLVATYAQDYRRWARKCSARQRSSNSSQ